MHLKSVEVENYKCFREPTRVELDPSMTVIVGRNNAGKSALLEALGLRFGNRPHRSLASARPPSAAAHAESRASFSVKCTFEDVAQLTALRRGEICFPVETGIWNGREDGNRLLRVLLGTDGGSPLISGRRTGAPKLVLDDQQFLGLYRSDRYGSKGLRAWHEYTCYGDGRAPAWARVIDAKPAVHAVDALLFSSFVSNVYAFSAERLCVGQCEFGSRNDLEPDASNLPEVLLFLQANPTMLARYNACVTRVLPQVQWVSARASRARLQTVEVLVWSHDWESARDDLAIPLLESGTGVSQVLAMLYVVLTADTPKTIIIDEPNSFLHPGGVAALLEVFREHPQHQYILSTHSPAVIADANPQRVYIVENEGNEAHVVEVDPGAVDQQRAILGAVGARLGDVFGPERILWVEGKTEEQGFPLIARKEGLSLANTRMLAVVNTGDFNRRLIGTTSTVYRQLTEGVALIPPACGFVFDRETGTEEEQERLKQVCAGKLEFLPRRMYENYLLDPEAIAAVLNQTDSLKTANTNATAVAAWITANEQRFAYKGDTSPTRTDGASLLSALFSDLTEAREQYNKVFHGVQLTSWLLAHRPEALFEIAELLRRMLGQTDAEWPPPSPPEQAP